MEEAEPPECPVCLQVYDELAAIPRVLSCGHTTCEDCLKQLPRPFPNTIRCTVCTLLVKLPNSPSSLPKNIDLLHFSSALQHRRPIKEKKVIPPLSPPEIGDSLSVVTPSPLNSWSFEFYRTWKKWILPNDCILIENSGSDLDVRVRNGKVLKSFDSDHVIGWVLSEKANVGMIKVGVFVQREENPNLFKFSYESRIVTVLYEMKETERNILTALLNATHRVSNVGKACGFWYNEDDECVYVVWEKITSPHNLIDYVIKKKEDERERLSAEELTVLGMVGMQICEILNCLHFQGVVIGFLNSSCFSFSDFGHVCVDLSEVLSTGRRVIMADSKTNSKNDLFDLNCVVFISPEMLIRLFVLQESRYDVGFAADVWCVASLLVCVILGGSFTEEVKSFFCAVVSAVKDENHSVFWDLYSSWVEKIAALLEGRLGLECASLREILCRCLVLEPENRPVMAELWKCLRELVIKPEFDIGFSSKQEVKKENFGDCVILGDVCLVVEETEKETGNSDDGTGRGDVKYVEMKGHLDCVTGLAIGGGFLFSSSYDKMIRVWSLLDFTHLHSFKGHEHRITSVVYMDGEQPLCISGDNEGVIFIWEARVPFLEQPLRKLYENKDWRYSGIHAMAISVNGCLYTGSGDKLVKAWSLKDYTISCEMTGHRSVVSCLVVSGDVLYSGSWDGSVRLWSLSDHSPLAVIEDNNAAPVLSLSFNHGLLFIGRENGVVKIWRDAVFVKSVDTHRGAVFSVCTNGTRLFSGGWDKTINIDEISGNIDVTSLGSITCNSTITCLVYGQGKLYVGQADRSIKVYSGV